MTLIRGDIGLLTHIQDIELMVGVASALCPRHLGGADVHAAVQLGGIRIEDFGTTRARGGAPLPGERVGQVERQL